MSATERPILFSGPMVRAILDGRKVQTRRVVTIRREHGGGTPTEHYTADARVGRFDIDSCGDLRFGAMFYAPSGADLFVQSPFGIAGDRLWVRESAWLYGRWYEDGVTAHGRTRWRFDEFGRRVVFKCPLDHELTYRGSISPGYVLRPSIHMPRWASRIMLEITDVRVERLQDISERHAQAEGVETVAEIDYSHGRTYALAFRHLWDSINAKRGYSWDSNPWVWALTFSVKSTDSENDSETGKLP